MQAPKKRRGVAKAIAIISWDATYALGCSGTHLICRCSSRSPEISKVWSGASQNWEKGGEERCVCFSALSPICEQVSQQWNSLRGMYSSEKSLNFPKSSYSSLVFEKVCNLTCLQFLPFLLNFAYLLLQSSNCDQMIWSGLNTACLLIQHDLYWRQKRIWYSLLFH